MAKSASEHAIPAAPTSAKAARGMHDAVVRTTDAAAKMTTIAHGSSSLPTSSLASQFVGTGTDGHPPPSANTKRATAKPNTKDASLAHQAALHRINARTTAATPPSSKSTTSSQPVLVNAAPNPADMRRKQRQQQHQQHQPQPETQHPHTNQPPNTSSPLPTPEDFSISEILSSIGPEASTAIDAIAEICGRSKLSLADEHDSHMPPHGEVEALPIARMETLDESRRHGMQTTTTRAMARRLALARQGDTVATHSDATAATSGVISHAPPSRSGRRRGAAGGGGGRSGEARAVTATTTAGTIPPSSIPMLPLVLSWLRGTAAASGSEVGTVGGDEVGAGSAAGTLHRLLSEDGQMRS